ncbi:MAG TPA: Rieske 2Fe-2S domain-containing protein [Chloroflexota bacterium]|jgi:5,5'-dehydrodivanillate O-demethylase
MLTREENELLTRVGPGTPGGALLRRYWQPACYVGELSATQPTKRVKLLDEELVVFRTPAGEYGCLAEHCAHRGASLAYGFVEDCGLRCAYHGWKYGLDGACLEQPFEPAGSSYARRTRQPAYPAQALGGVVFVYLGPAPAPLLPRWDVLAWTQGQRKLTRQETLSCNWLQAQENTADITHTYFLHGHMLHQQGFRGRQVDYYYRPFEQYGFQPFEWGLIKSWRFGAGDSPLGAEWGGGAPLIFPNVLRVVEKPWHTMHWRVPIDDTHTRIVHVGFLLGEPALAETLENPPIEDHPPQVDADGEYVLTGFYAQDKMAWETQGTCFDRTQEHLGASDRGIILFRQMLREQIAVVQRGGEPLGVLRDPAHNTCIDLPAWVAEIDAARVGALVGAEPSAQTMADVFDARHEIFEVPFGAARPA